MLITMDRCQYIAYLGALGAASFATGVACKMQAGKLVMPDESGFEFRIEE